MYQSQQFVRDMMDAFGQQYRDFPNMIQDDKERLLATNLVIEEAFEFVDAMGYKISVDDNGKPVLTQSHAPHLADAAKELGDIQVVIDGAANRLGLDMQTIFVAVNASNMSKTVNGKVIRRESDGKVLKPDTYRAVDMSVVIAEQREKQIRSTIEKNYPKLQIKLAQGQDLYSTVTEAILAMPEISYNVIQTIYETDQQQSLIFKSRVLIKDLLFFGVNNQVNVADLSKAIGLSESSVLSNAQKASNLFPLLFSNQIIEPPVDVTPLPPTATPTKGKKTAPVSTDTAPVTPVETASETTAPVEAAPTDAQK